VEELIPLGLVGGVLLLLGIATTVLHLLRNRDDSSLDTAMLRTFRMRVRAWWALFAILALAFLIGKIATVVLFGLMSFWALREFITLTPTRPGDHRALFWVFFLFTPLQFVLVGMAWYEMYSIVVPIYGLLFVPARVALAGDYKRFLERVAKIQAGLLICVYCLSYAPALLTLDLPTPKQAAGLGKTAAVPPGNAAPADPAENPAAPAGSSDDDAGEDQPYWGANLALLFFFVLIVQLSDALQYAWSQIPSRHPIAPLINPNKTWEGLLGGTGSVALIGAALWWATPFTFERGDWWMAPALSMVIAVMGFAGSITMSAIKRDRGVKDYGTLVEGHGGILDRIDSLCFAAPVFFHLMRLWLQWQAAK